MLNKNILMYIFLKFKLYLRWERLTKVNSYQNCNNVIENFYSTLPKAAPLGLPKGGALCACDEIFIQEKINKGLSIIKFFIILHHIMNKCRIEKILISYNNIYCKIMKMLKVGKLVKFYLLLKLPKVYFWKVLNTLQSGCRIIYQAKALGNTKDRLYLTNSWECWIRYCFYKKLYLYIYNFTWINDFKKDCDNIFKSNLSINIILDKLKKLIFKYKNYNNKRYSTKDRFLKNYIHNKSWIWAIKKHRKLGKNKIYDLYFKKGKNNFSTLKFNNSNFYCNYNFPLAKPNLKFINVKKNYELINKSLINLDSGIYLFWLLDDPSKCYIGSAINLKRRFYIHYKLYNNKQPKFYNCVNKYSWSNFGFQIIELVNNNDNLINKEQFWLDILFHCPFYKNNTLNLLNFSNNWKNHKHTSDSKNLISIAAKGR